MNYISLINNMPQTLMKIAVKLCLLSKNNIIWSCLFSGMGIINTLKDKEYKKLVAGSDIINCDKELLNNTAMLKCIYKKGKPIFSTPPEYILNAGKYMWEFNSFKKLILPEAQSFAILSLLSAGEYLNLDEEVLREIILRNSRIYYDFSSAYLRNTEGLFVSAEDKTKDINDELKIKESKKEAKLINQIYFFEALMMLDNTISPCSEDNKSPLIIYKDEARNIFNYIYENYHLLLEMSSKEISLSISSLARCSKNSKDAELLASCNHLIALLCAELETRIKINGEVERNFDDLSASSFITHFRAASALIEGYLETEIEKFKDISKRIFNYIEDFYDYASGLFITGDYSEVSYSIRDICEIIKGLLLHYAVSKREDVLEMLVKFYTAAVENSGILQCVVKRNDAFLGNDAEFPECIPLMDENQKAPVFLKSFRLSREKIYTCSASKHYNSYYSLYSSYLFIHYFGEIARLINKNPI